MMYRQTLLVPLLLVTGCFWVTTKHEGEVLRKDLNTLARRVNNAQGSFDQKVAQLESVLERATKLLQRNSADLGAEVADLSKEQSRVAGLLEEAKRLLTQMSADLTARQDDMEQRLAALETKASAPPKQSIEDQYAEAEAALKSKKYSKAAKLFRDFSVRHRKHKLADDAQYFRAEAHYGNKEYKTAIGEFQRLFETFPKSDLAAKSLLRAGESAEKMKWCTDAIAYFGILRQKFPRSRHAKKARRKTRELKRASKNKKKCKS